MDLERGAFVETQLKVCISCCKRQHEVGYLVQTKAKVDQAALGSKNKYWDEHTVLRVCVCVCVNVCKRLMHVFV